MKTPVVDVGNETLERISRSLDLYDTWMKLFNRLVPLSGFEQRLALPLGISSIAIAEPLPDPEAS